MWRTIKCFQVKRFLLVKGDDFGERCCMVLIVHLTFPEDGKTTVRKQVRFTLLKFKNLKSKTLTSPPPHDRGMSKCAPAQGLGNKVVQWPDKFKFLLSNNLSLI